MICPKCDSNCAVKNGFVKGVQRYKCKQCGCQYTREIPRGAPIQTKILAFVLYLSGLSMNMSGKIVGVSGQSVMRWIKQFGSACIEEQKNEEMEEEIEIDEMHHFIGKKNGFFGYGKYLVINLANSLAGNVAIVVRKPLNNYAINQGHGAQNEYILTNTMHMPK